MQAILKLDGRFSGISIWELSAIIAKHPPTPKERKAQFGALTFSAN
jgi:hypothetical protein